MTKVLNLEDLDCANCAAKIEQKISKLEGIKSVSVSFMTQKMVLEVEDDVNFDSLVKEIKKTVKKVEPDCTVLYK